MRTNSSSLKAFPSLQTERGWPVRETLARSILSPVTGFLKEAGFTHSLSPARNCTFGCTYCYVPTMRVFGGLQREDWERWGQFTTIKRNAPELYARQARPEQIVYCSPLVDPYQPAEKQDPLMPALLESVLVRPPRVFVLQTRGPLILRDVALLRELAARTRLRISFSVTTTDEGVRRRYEPHCASNPERLDVIRQLRAEGLEVYCTLAPLLPCDPERLVELAVAASGRDLICDPLHVRSTKPGGATTREAAWQIARHHDEGQWWDPRFQEEIVRRMRAVAQQHGFKLVCGPAGFSALARVDAGDGG